MRDAFYEAIIEYGVTSNKPTLPSSIAGYWPMIKKALDTSKQRYDAGKKGGESSKESRFGSSNKKNKDNENNKERENNKENNTADAASAGTDSALLLALQGYDTMRQEKRKALTDTMRRSLCEQLNSEFQPCEWVAIIKQATLRGWMQFYPLDEPKPQQSQQRQPTAEEEYTRLFNEVCGGGTP